MEAEDKMIEDEDLDAEFEQLSDPNPPSDFLQKKINSILNLNANDN